MNHSSRLLKRPGLQRALSRLSTLLAAGALIMLALATFLSDRSAASSGALTPRITGPQSSSAARSGHPDQATPPAKEPPADQVIVGEAVQFDVSKPLRDIIPPPVEPVSIIREMGQPGETEGGFILQDRSPGEDPVVQRQFGAAPDAPVPAMPSPIVNFAGIGNLDGVYPPDTEGDVGPNHYVQWVNLHFQVFNKSGTSIYGPAAGNAIWSGFGGQCETSNDGDPIVLYDALADRWLMTQFVASAPYGECVAVSVTGDPTGAYYRYFFQFSTTIFYDYPKLGVWPDGYYLSANRFNASSIFVGASAIVLNRANMLNGQSATYQEFQTVTSYGTLLPADHDGSTLPPAGSPNFFAEIGATALHLWRFHVDWATPANSTFTGPTSLTVAAFTQLCAATRNCIPQNGTSQRLDAIGDRLMHRLVYRNFGDHETLVVNHTVNAGGGQAAVRWYEVRNPNGAASLYQQGTYAPDATHRWMGSLALDRAGNMALGYSASSATMYPSIRYTGRLVTDTLGQMPQGETSIITGTGAQTGIGARWGDYSNMSIDPVDDCTFWYTNEYLATTGVAPWVTRIGSFAFPSCTGVGAISGTVVDAGTSNPLSGVTVTLGTQITTTNGSGVYQFLNIPATVYPSIVASYPGYNSSSAGPITVTAGLTTTQNFTLSVAPALGCYVDTTQADFQAGVPTNCDLTSSPGDIILLNPANIDQHADDNGFGSGYGFNSSSLIGQTFTPSVTGQLTRVDAYIFCAGCSGTNPDMTLEVRTTSGGNPVMTAGGLLASSTISGTSSSSGGLFSFTYNTLPTLTAGTQYGVVIRLVSNRTGTQAWLSSNGDVYAGGRRKTCTALACSDPTGVNNNSDLIFMTYMQTGYSSPGSFVAGVKNANPLGTFTPRWTTLAWNATTPASTTIKFQAAASNSPTGPFTFVGPDGTASTYYTTTGASLSQFDGLRYLKYTAYLTTTNSANTPTLADVTICFSNTVKITPTISIASSQNPSLIGQAVTFTASVTSGAGMPTGQIQFQDNGANLGAMQNLSSGSATIVTSTLTVGSHTITANYLGSAFFNANSGMLVPDQIVTSTVTWNGNTSTNWFVASNWTPAAVPTTAASVIVPTTPSGNRWPILTGTATIDNLTLQSGAVLTISQGIALNVNELVANNGALAQIKDVPASVTTEFLRITDASGTVDKYHGVDLTPAAAMGTTTVQIKGNQPACTTVPTDPIVHRCFRIDPTTQAATTVRFWYTEAERNAQAANALRLWHWSPWTQVGTLANYTYSESGATCTSGGGQACWFQSTGVASYSPFALGSGSSPTAIHLTRVDSQSAAASPIVPLIVVMMLGLSMSLVVLRRRRA